MARSQSKRISAQSKEKGRFEDNIKEHLAALSESINLLLQEKMEEKAQIEQKVAALENRNLELEEAAQAISAEKADCEQKLASVSGTIDKLVLEKAEEKAKCEQRLAATSETIDRRVLERTEKLKAECEQRLAAMLETMEKRFLERMEIQRAECDMKLSAMSERVDKMVQEKAEEKAGCEQKLASMSGTIDKLVLEKAEEKAKCEQRLAATSETIDRRVLERTEKLKAECEQRLAAMLETMEKRFLERMEIQRAECDMKLSAMSERVDKMVQEKAEEKAGCEQKLASMSGTIDKLVLEKAEEKQAYEQRLAAMPETIEKRVLERTEIQKAECERKLAGFSEIITLLLHEKREMQMEAMIQLNSSVMAEPIDLSIQATAEREALMDHNMPALEGRDQAPQEIFLSKERTRMDVKAHAVDKRTTVLVQAAHAIYEERMEFRDRSAAKPDTIDWRLLTTTQEKMMATSTDPINMAPGSRDPSDIQSNCSELLKGQQPQQEGALNEEGAHEDPCRSCIPFDESLRSQWRDVHDRTLEIASRDLDGEQDKETAALDCSSVSQLQEGVRLSPPEQSPNPETPAVEEEIESDDDQNLSETSDELSLGPERPAELEESLELLNSDERLMKRKGLNLLSQLAKDQPETLFPHTHDISRAVLWEVLNPLDLVSQAALDTLGDLLSLPRRYFDPLLVSVADALYLKAASDNETIQLLTNVALGHMIQNCNPLICMSVLLDILSNPSLPDPDQEVVARECFAIHLLALVESGRCKLEMPELFLSVSQLIQDTSEVVRSCAEKMLAVLSTHVEEKMTATSTDLINMAPTAPGSRDPSNIQSNCSELLKGQQPQQEGALNEEGPLEDPCRSCIPFDESLRSQWRDVHDRTLEIASRDLDGEQDKQTAALDCSSVSQLQEGVRLSPPEQSPNPETPAVEEEMETDEDQNLSETSDELSLGPERPAELEESLKLLNSDERLMKMNGLHIIYQLAKDQPETLFPHTQDISRAVLREVLNPLDSVSAVALDTLGDLLSLLKRNFDPFLYWVANALFQKAASDNKTLQLLTNVALGHMIGNCSPLICMKVLYYILSYESVPDPDQVAVARECFAVHLLALVESARYEPDMHVLLLTTELTQDTSEVVRTCAEKMLAVLSTHVEESTEFLVKSPDTPDTIDLRLLTTTQEKMTATSTDLINMAPTAPGSRDPSNIQSNCSELLKGQQPQQEGALNEEGPLEDPCRSCIPFDESLRSQWRDAHDRTLEIASRDLDGEQDKQTAALDCSSVSQLQEGVRLSPPEQSPNPETPAVEEEMESDDDQNLSETSDELSLGLERPAELEESLKLLNSDERWMKMNGLCIICQLAKDQPETLFPHTQDICWAVLGEVLNPLDLVSQVALDTLGDLLSLLKRNFDPLLFFVADALYLKAASDNETIQLLTNVALGHMIQNCSPLMCMKVLLYILSYPSMEDPEKEAVARECFAVHLLALVESARYEPEMHEHFLSVSQLTQDTSEVVRTCAEKMLAVLSTHVEESQLVDPVPY